MKCLKTLFTKTSKKRKLHRSTFGERYTSLSPRPQRCRGGGGAEAKRGAVARETRRRTAVLPRPRAFRGHGPRGRPAGTAGGSAPPPPGGSRMEAPRSARQNRWGRGGRHVPRCHETRRGSHFEKTPGGHRSNGAQPPGTGRPHARRARAGKHVLPEGAGPGERLLPGRPSAGHAEACGLVTEVGARCSPPLSPGFQVVGMWSRPFGHSLHSFESTRHVNRQAA